MTAPSGQDEGPNHHPRERRATRSRLSRWRHGITALHLLHRLAHLALGALILAGLLLAGFAWRLSQGPVDVSWFAGRLEAAVNQPDSPLRLHVGGSALTWEGFRLGVDHPLDLRLTGVTLTDSAGRQRLAVAQARVSLSIGALLVGRVQPRAVALEGPRIAILRGPDGAISLDLGENRQPGGPRPGQATPLPELLDRLSRPPSSDRAPLPGWLAQLRRVRIDDASVVVRDERLGAVWQAPRAEIDLRRNPQGGLSGTADLTLELGAQPVHLHATATRDGGETRVAARIPALSPAALARQAQALAPLAAFDGQVAVEARGRFDRELALLHAHAALTAQAGTAHIGTSEVPVVSAALVLDGTPGDLRVESAEAQVRGRPDGPVSTLRAEGELRRAGGMIGADLSVTLDQVSFADLPLLWPRQLGGHARAWVVANIPEGSARNGHVALSLRATPDLSRIELADVSGGVDGEGLAVHWLRPVPPIEDGAARLRIVDPDTLEIIVSGGRQVLRQGGALALTGGSMRITGLTRHEQTGVLVANIAGTLPDALALLREPRLELLSRHPIPFSNPAGEVTAKLSVTLPLDANVTMDAIAIRAAAHLQGVHLGAVAAGRDLDRGTLDLEAGNDGLTLKGSAVLAGIPAQLDAAMDFRAGPPAQVVRRVTLSGRTDASQLAAAGLDATGLLSGPLSLRAMLREQRNGLGSIQVQSDLTPATLEIQALDWRKPAGETASASAQLRMVNDRIEAIDAFAVDGQSLSVRGSAAFSDGHPVLVRLDRAVLGRSELHGSVRLPQAPGTAPIAVTLSGPVLDLSARLARSRTQAAPRAPEPPPGPAWTLDARFDRVLAASGYLLAPVTVRAENDGQVMRRLHVAGDTGPNAPFDLRITPEGTGRRLTATVARAGDLLRALDWLRTMQDGQLRVTGTYDDTRPGHPLSGSAELDDFRVAEAAALGKLLQAMTLYGLVDALRGPGLSFRRAIVPFRLAGGVLDLSEARAFSPSLGLTAKGQIDLDANRIDVQGTIVPAYFFNSLLGHVPLLGRLLSPEQGGGVFAARYTLRGRLDDPDVSVNPLAALTPGFLREFFGLF